MARGIPPALYGDRWFSEPPLPTPFFPFGEGFTPRPNLLPLDLEEAFREGLERLRWPKMAPRGPQRAQDGLQDRSR